MHRGRVLLGRAYGIAYRGLIAVSMLMLAACVGINDKSEIQADDRLLASSPWVRTDTLRLALNGSDTFAWKGPELGEMRSYSHMWAWPDGDQRDVGSRQSSWIVLELDGFEGGLGLGMAEDGPGTPYEVLLLASPELENCRPSCIPARLAAGSDEAKGRNVPALAFLKDLEGLVLHDDTGRACQNVEPSAFGDFLRAGERQPGSYRQVSRGGSPNPWAVMSAAIYCSMEWTKGLEGNVTIKPLAVVGSASDEIEVFRIDAEVMSQRSVLEEARAFVGRLAGLDAMPRAVDSFFVRVHYQGSGRIVWDRQLRRIRQIEVRGSVDMTSHACGSGQRERILLKGVHEVMVTFGYRP